MGFHQPDEYTVQGRPNGRRLDEEGITIVAGQEHAADCRDMTLDAGEPGIEFPAHFGGKICGARLGPPDDLFLSRVRFH